MPQPRVFVLRAPGTNCDGETAHAFERAGAAVERIHVNRWLETPRMAADYQILCVPGGFSYGDDIAAGRILATKIRQRLSDAIAEFVSAGKLVLGVCNGFQVLLQTGALLADLPDGGRAATLTLNDSGRFEDRWVHLKVGESRCVFLRGVESLYLPIAHAEGKFVARDPATLQALQDAGHVALRYATAGGRDDASIGYPDNPNGSMGNVAGVCDVSGRVFGLMPHPERYIERTHHPRWTRGEGRDPGDGMKVFENAVKEFA